MNSSQNTVTGAFLVVFVMIAARQDWGRRFVAWLGLAPSSTTPAAGPPNQFPNPAGFPAQGVGPPLGVLP